MGIVSKTSIKFSIILFVGIALGYINTVLIFPNVLTEEEFGLTRILMSASAVIAQLAQLGSPNIIVHFHPHLKGDKKNITLSIGLLISLVGLFLALVFLLIFDNYVISLYQEKSELFARYFYLLLPYITSLIFYNLFDAYLRVVFKNNVSAFLNFILLRILWLAVVGLYYFEYLSTASFIKVYVACQFFIALTALGYIIHLRKLHISFRFNRERFQLLKKMYHFGVFTIISGISIFLINRIDILMVGKYVGLEGVAIYSIAFYISSVIMVPAQSISRTAIVLAANAAKNNDLKTVASLYKKTALNQLLFCSIIFILIVINYKNLMYFLPVIYRDSFLIFLLLGLAKVVETGFGINGGIIINSKYFRVDTFLSIILLLLTVASNLYFIPSFGIQGAATATMISIVIFNVLRYLFLKIKLNLDPFTWQYLGVIFILSGSATLTYIVPSLSSVWTDMITRSILFLILSVPTIYLLKLSPELNKLVNNVLPL
ncbi:Putative membrane export protein [Fulvivirga imtechensis AK7]|uniref:Putative membrane export protein n=1 Tax=Fulvivirga imtechensis AK7 TaxID=1237149 RepID=L8JQD4_9BACT|nr:oligosaccharide flippase family protein [Fulvivirga imtechensis]ELR69587.1 Putative membrane export protein [Fulvivirga imtechensis AK7]